jgi:hypothetical protein
MLTTVVEDAGLRMPIKLFLQFTWVSMPEARATHSSHWQMDALASLTYAKATGDITLRLR